jgi:hypothetical protein
MPAPTTVAVFISDTLVLLLSRAVVPLPVER